MPVCYCVEGPCTNPFPNKPLFLLICIASLLKPLWEKEKLLTTSNFSFSHSGFKRLALVFTYLHSKSFETTVGKGEIAHNEQFLLFPQCFLPF